jgi:hypothetical protein
MANAKRPFKIKLNIAGLCVMTIIPFSIYLIALSGSFMQSQNFNAALFGVIALLSAEIIWQIIVWFNPSVKAATVHVP